MSAEKREIELAEFASIMGDVNGRKVLRRILDLSGAETDTFHPDPMVHAKNAGARQVGLWLKRELMEADLGRYLKMMTETEDG